MGKRVTTRAGHCVGNHRIWLDPPKEQNALSLAFLGLLPILYGCPGPAFISQSWSLHLCIFVSHSLCPPAISLPLSVGGPISSSLSRTLSSFFSISLAANSLLLTLSVPISVSLSGTSCFEFHTLAGKLCLLNTDASIPLSSPPAPHQGSRRSSQVETADSGAKIAFLVRRSRSYTQNWKGVPANLLVSWMGKQPQRLQGAGQISCRVSEAGRRPCQVETPDSRSGYQTGWERDGMTMTPEAISTNKRIICLATPPQSSASMSLRLAHSNMDSLRGRRGGEERRQEASWVPFR